MANIKFLILLLAVIGAVQCLIESRTGTGSTGNPLYLTPYIRSGRLYDGRNAARVSNNELSAKGVESYSGYLTVNTTYNSNLFFWFIKAQTNSANAPVLLWLQGGPGASSLYGLFIENGPVSINSQNKFESRQYSWNKNFNLLYIDNPVGAGFSFTDSAAGYATNQDQVGDNLFEGVKQFFQLFSQYRKNKFFAAGESYAGKYVPTLAYRIYLNRNSADPYDRINLQGISIGNGVTDPINQLQFGEYFNQLGFIDKTALATFNARQNYAISLIQAQNYTGALVYAFSLINTPGCEFNKLSGFTSPYNNLEPNGYNPLIDRVSNYLVNSTISSYLHVGSRTFVPFTDTNLVLGYLQNDILQSVAPWVATLANNYPVLIYSGQLDLLVGSVLMQNWLSQLQYNGASAYASAPRQIWTVDDEIAGYFKIGGNLTEFTIRRAGHMMPADQPKWAFNLITKFTSGSGF